MRHYLQLTKDGQFEIVKSATHLIRCPYSMRVGTSQEVLYKEHHRTKNNHNYWVQRHNDYADYTLEQLEALEKERQEIWNVGCAEWVRKVEELNMSKADRKLAFERSVTVGEMIAALQKLDSNSRLVIKQYGSDADGAFANVEIDLHKVMTVDGTDYSRWYRLSHIGLF